ncbi:hypothetical protein ACFY64_31780 [Streptomyces collinus]|uniref:hypothetical protein n=1 Tax=Streptomyces collinus TaxID=42684 RepID=UPI00367A27E0
MSLTSSLQATPSQLQALKDKAIGIYNQRTRTWDDFRALPQEEQDRQDLLCRRVLDHLWDEYGKAWVEYLEAKEVLDKEAGLKENKARAEKVRSQTCMTCFEVRATNGTCGC